MKFEVGKYYRTRSGQKVKVIYTTAQSPQPIIGLLQTTTGEECHHFFPDGRWIGYSSDEDLVAEWDDSGESDA